MSGRQWRVETYYCLVFEFTENRYLSLTVCNVYIFLSNCYCLGAHGVSLFT